MEEMKKRREWKECVTEVNRRNECKEGMEGMDERSE
jgi:hypothetical protein